MKYSLERTKVQR